MWKLLKVEEQTGIVLSDSLGGNLMKLLYIFPLLLTSVLDWYQFDADPDPISMLMPIQIRIGIRTMPILMRKDPTPSFTHCQFTMFYLPHIIKCVIVFSPLVSIRKFSCKKYSFSTFSFAWIVMPWMPIRTCKMIHNTAVNGTVSQY